MAQTLNTVRITVRQKQAPNTIMYSQNTVHRDQLETHMTDLINTAFDRGAVDFEVTLTWRGRRGPNQATFVVSTRERALRELDTALCSM